MATNVEQYIDIDGLRQLLELIKKTYVCQNGLTSKVREQIYEILADIGSNSQVKISKADNRTDPSEIANNSFPDIKWKNGDLLCVENTSGHMSVFYWYNSLWICISKAPVDEINIDDTPEHLKKLIPTAAAVVKLTNSAIEKVNQKISEIEDRLDSTETPEVSVDIATSETAGIVAPNKDEFIIDPITGKLTLNNISISKITNLQNELDAKPTLKDVLLSVYSKNEVYTKDEIDTKLDDISSGGVDLSNYYTKDEINQLIILSSNDVIHVEGSVESKEELPKTDTLSIGTVYEIADGTKFCWDGTSWVQIANEASTDTWDSF